jgi:hypothetical protein
VSSSVSEKEQGRSYEVRQGGQVVAYVRVSETGVLVTPKRLSETALCELQQSLEEGVLPHGVVARQVAPAQGFKRERPNWGELTASTWKRNRWLKARRSSTL